MTVHLVVGDDESLVRAAVSDLVHRLVGGGDRSLMVDEFDGDDVDLAAVVDAAQTLPFLTDRRVVVVRGIGRFPTEVLDPLVGYLANPLDTTDLVMVGGGGRLPKAFSDAVKKSGVDVIDTAPPSRPRDRQGWVSQRATEAGVKLSGPAAAVVAERLGEDVGRLDGVLSTLAATYGTGRALTPPEIEPFLGEGGGVPPWDLTDAIDGGDTAKALTLLARMSGPGGRHPLQLMAILHQHYGRLARLDGVDARSEADAAAALGIKPGFPARKALQQHRRLGGGGVQRAVALLAAADLDLRGAKDLDDDVVMEVLVARLSRLGR
ncbi:MAG TPA: DNA polymerase III subunit delta [Acidimicrobiales bacterium]|nr:DNA polymerase III subunit delta [Acidimicrobiales bacterium]